MGESMSPQITIPSEHLATGGALIGLVVGVGQQMGLQIRALIETTIAHWTLVRRFLHMQYLVNSQGSRLTETLPTFRAFEWLLLRVNVSEMKKLKL